jgi:ABC-type phosphate transport system ATPase subunit
MNPGVARQANGIAFPWEGVGGVAFLLLGEVIEQRRTQDLFLVPKDARTAAYVDGRYR